MICIINPQISMAACQWRYSSNNSTQIMKKQWIWIFNKNILLSNHQHTSIINLQPRNMILISKLQMQGMKINFNLLIFLAIKTLINHISPYNNCNSLKKEIQFLNFNSNIQITHHIRSEPRTLTTKSRQTNWWIAPWGCKEDFRRSEGK